MKAFEPATAWFGTQRISSKMIIFRLNYTGAAVGPVPGEPGAGGYTPLLSPTYTGISLLLKAVEVSGRFRSSGRTVQMALAARPRGAERL